MEQKPIFPTMQTVPNQPEIIAPPPPTPVKITLRVSRDGMQVELLLQKTSNNTLPPTIEDINAALAENNIVFGIDNILIQAICRRPVYRPMIIAKGRPPRTGKNGEVVFLFETRRDLRPKLREDGTVDYRDLGFTQNVTLGQALCEIIPPTKGDDGTDVFGQPREGQYGRVAPAPVGRNTVLTEDGLYVVAQCAGSVEYSRGTVNVHEMLRINGNVDNSTGNIEFVGDIIITGDVLSGFQVITTDGSITVHGSVEGAHLRAAGDILIRAGINGMERGMVEAEGTIKCKYMQSCRIKAGGDIYTDSIMYCNLECSGNVELKGKRAALIGGTSAIAGKLTAKNIGTDSHVATKIIMASTGVETTQEIANLQSELVRIDMESQKLVQDMARYDSLLREGRLAPVQQTLIAQTREMYTELITKRELISVHQQKLKDEQLIASQENNIIECSGTIHVGVQFTFGPLNLNVHNSYDYSRVCIIDNDICVVPL